MAENGNRDDEGRGGPDTQAGTQPGAQPGGTQPGAQPGAQPQQTPQVKILAHFVRDLSFENVGVVQGTPAQGQPDISVAVHLDGSKMSEDAYQVSMKITAKAVREQATRFLVELDYGGVFSIQNAPETHIHPILFIECPRQLFPFARRVVSDVTRDGGYPPLLLDNIDFAQLYRQKVEEMRRQQAEGGQGGEQGGEQAGAQGAAAAPAGNGQETGGSAGGSAEGGTPGGSKPN